MSTSSYFLWVGNIAVDKMDTLLSKIVHSDKEYRFKNNKTINQIGVMLEDKQGEEMEKNSLGRGALESVLRESFSGDLFELRKKRMGERTNINVWVKSILEIKNSV